MPLDRALHARLSAVQARGLRRSRRCLETPQAPEQVVDGRLVTAFCANDYLGLAADPRLVAAAKQALNVYGLGAGAAHLVNGHYRAHAELEEMLADFTGRPRALLFSTGYMANLGTLGALLSRHDHAVADRLNHASLLDGVRLSGCRSLRYQHADAGDAERKLAAASREHLRLIVTDGVFSMDGDLAPLPELAALAHRQNAVLMVDDAHGFGVLGHQGGGCCEHFQLSAQEVPILVGTLGKAMGTGGAFVAGSEALIDALIQFARPYVYTTAMPPAIAAATRVALQIAREETWRRERLLSLITRLRAGLTQLGLPLPPGTTPIQPIILGSTARATRASAALLERGFLVPAIRPPTVPEGSGRLRITLSAAHTEQQIEDLIDALAIILSGSGNANEGTV